MSNSLYGVIVSNDDKSKKHERFLLLDYLNEKQMGNAHFLDCSKQAEDALASYICHHIDAGSTILLTDLTLLGTTLCGVVASLKQLLRQNINIHSVSDQQAFIAGEVTIAQLDALECTCGMLADKQRERRRERLAQNGVKVGRKKGVLVQSKFDRHRESIEHLYKLGLSMQKIVDHIGIGTQQSLFHYIKTRGITK